MHLFRICFAFVSKPVEVVEMVVLVELMVAEKVDAVWGGHGGGGGGGRHPCVQVGIGENSDALKQHKPRDVKEISFDVRWALSANACAMSDRIPSERSIVSLWVHISMS